MRFFFLLCGEKRERGFYVEKIILENVERAIRLIKPEFLFDYIKAYFENEFRGGFVLRWAINKVDAKAKIGRIEATVVYGKKPLFPGAQSFSVDAIRASRMPHYVLLIVPTGVGAHIGGGTGDGGPVVSYFSRVFEVISHPNMVNGAAWEPTYSKLFLYVEGSIIDSLPYLYLLPIQGMNNIGVIIDKAVDDYAEKNIRLTIQAARAAGNGLNILDPIKTSEPLGCCAVKLESGAFTGHIKNPTPLIEAGMFLKKEKKVQAIAVATRIDASKLDLRKYFDSKQKGEPNPYGALEAIVSHLLVFYCGLPAAHGPALSFDQAEFFKSFTQGESNPFAATELVSGEAFLKCVLTGLSRAPRIIAREMVREYLAEGLMPDDLTGLRHIGAVIVPHSCMGGAPMLIAAKYGIPIITVKENKTVLDVTPDKLGYIEGVHYESALDYEQALGKVVRIFSGITREAIRRK